MKKLINMLFAGKSINTSKGKLTFDKDGACVLEDEVADAFKDVKGFVVENDSENNDNTNDEKNSDQTVITPENDSNAADGDKEDSTDDSENETDAEDDDDNTNEDDTETDGSEDDNTDAEDTADDVNLDSLSVPSLKKFAKDNGIDITGLTTKEPILKAIKEAIQK